MLDLLLQYAEYMLVLYSVHAIIPKMVNIALFFIAVNKRHSSSKVSTEYDFSCVRFVSEPKGIIYLRHIFYFIPVQFVPCFYMKETHAMLFYIICNQ